jgi:hypothetical protein
MMRCSVAAGLGHGDRFTAHLANLAARRDRLQREDAEAVDLAAAHGHIVLLIGGAQRQAAHQQGILVRGWRADEDRRLRLARQVRLKRCA